MRTDLAALLEDLRHPDESRREAAREALAAGGPEARHALLGALEHPDLDVVAGALGVLGEEGAGGPEAARAVLRALRAERRVFAGAGQAAEASAAMAGLREHLEPLVAGAIRTLADPDPVAHGAAAREVETFTHFLGAPEGVEAPEFVGALLGALGDDCLAVRWAAALALGSAGLDPARAVPALAALLADPVPLVRHAAAEALDGFHEASGAAEEALRAATRDPFAAVASRALRTLAGAARGGAVVEAMAAGLARPEPSVRAAAAAALGNLGGSARLAVDALAAAAEDPEPEVREAAEAALLRVRAGMAAW